MAQAPAQAPPLDEQPDFPKLQRNIAEISVEVGRFSNMPAIAGADRILEAIESMKTDLTATMTAQKTDLTAAMNSIKSELINQITISLRALDANTTARFVNNQNVRTLDSPVEKLVNVTNGADIPDFPLTFRQIMSLQNTELNAILSALGAMTTGTLTAKRNRIKRYCGIIPSL